MYGVCVSMCTHMTPHACTYDRHVMCVHVCEHTRVPNIRACDRRDVCACL